MALGSYSQRNFCQNFLFISLVNKKLTDIVAKVFMKNSSFLVLIFHVFSCVSTLRSAFASTLTFIVLFTNNKLFKKLMEA